LFFPAVVPEPPTDLELFPGKGNASIRVVFEPSTDDDESSIVDIVYEVCSSSEDHCYVITNGTSVIIPFNCTDESTTVNVTALNQCGTRSEPVMDGIRLICPTGKYMYQHVIQGM
jgi:hypothetical protein